MLLVRMPVRFPWIRASLVVLSGISLAIFPWWYNITLTWLLKELVGPFWLLYSIWKEEWTLDLPSSWHHDNRNCQVSLLIFLVARNGFEFGQLRINRVLICGHQTLHCKSRFQWESKTGLWIQNSDFTSHIAISSFMYYSNFYLQHTDLFLFRRRRYMYL